MQTQVHAPPKRQPARPPSPPSPCRLHIGAMGPHSLVHPALRKTIDASWVHLGDEPEISRRNPWLRFKNGMVRRLRPLVYRMRGTEAPNYDAIRRKTTFMPFYYRPGDELDFSDAQFGFIFSEHFFEHLFIDEAAALFEECHRLLKPGGVMRIAVPDADLRTYEFSEPVGYPNSRERWHEPDKHKTRWSVYSLAYVLGQAGFAVNPLVWCDKYGQFDCGEPQRDEPLYRNSLDEPFVFDLTCIKRLKSSLVIDAIKPGPGVEGNATELRQRLHRKPA